MVAKLMDLIFAIGAGFFSGVLVSGGGQNLDESGVHILLGCIFWLLVLFYFKRVPEKKGK